MGKRLRSVIAYLPEVYIECIDRYVMMKLFPNRSDFIREAVRYYIFEVERGLARENSSA